MSVFTKLYNTNIQVTVTLLLFCRYLCNTVEHSVFCKHGNKKISYVNEVNSTWHNQPESVGLFWHLLYMHVHRHWNFPIYLITETFKITNNKKFVITQHDGKTGLQRICYVPNFYDIQYCRYIKTRAIHLFSLTYHVIFKSQTFVQFGKQVCKWTNREEVSSILTLNITLLKQNKSCKIFFPRIFCKGGTEKFKGCVQLFMIIKKRTNKTSYFVNTVVKVKRGIKHKLAKCK